MPFLHPVRKERDLTFRFLCLCIIFGIIFYLSGCGEESEDGGPTLKSPEVLIISNTELLKYHPEEYLTGEIKSAPLLSSDKHPHGWQRADCTKCHRSPSREAPAVCTNCHGKNGVNNQPDTCDNCHKVSSVYGDPPSGQHRAHIGRGVKDTNCDECHPGKPENSDVHANGHLNIVFKAEDGKYNENLGLCQNIACHEDRQWPGEGCSLCHSPYPPDTGYHTKHLAQGELSCPACHEGNDHDDDKNSGRIEIGGVEYNSITGDCTSDCHKPQRWRCTDCHDYPPADGNHSQTTHEFSCDECHSGHDHSYKAAIRPKDFSEVVVELKQGGEYRDDTNDGVANGLCSPASACHETRRWGGSCTACHEQPPETGVHVLHVKREDNSCQDCHQGNEHGPDRGSGAIDIGGVEYDFINGDCTSSCHQQRRWDCTTCHGYPPKNGNHPEHQSLKLGCEQCHSGHRHSTNGVSVPDNLAPIQVNFALGGSFNSGNQLCSGIVCHEPRVWGSSCTDCHNSPPNTGAHQAHLATGDISCQACHKGNQHDADENSGSIEIGGVGYNFINGECTPVCHPPRQWPACTNCHRYPPDSGNHLAHNQPTGRYFGYPQQPILCDECHADHRHSYKAATAPNDFSEVEVRLQEGIFNPSNKLCSVSCHDPQKWGASCGDCHGAPPNTGRHSIHLQTNLNCDDCHKGHRHDLDISSGFIEVGDNIIYDQFTGDCASTCHEKKRWDCTSCHGYPPDTGHHTVHTKLSQFGCRICHENHEHTFKAATNPNDRRNVKVSFTILGDWDKSTNSCKNIGCHENKKW
ncbi:MAG: hypothetical protein ACE5PV_16745 [Candidatus Poribacteria bacterium]